MGARGVASFENDDALDLVADFEDAGWAAITAAIGAVGQSGYVEVPVAGRAIAAAELIASVLGHDDSRIPEIEFPEAAPDSSQMQRLRDSAVAALSRVLADSELRELGANYRGP